MTNQSKIQADFITLLSHELRTPLTSAMGYLYLINEGKLEGKGLENGLKSVTRSVAEASELVNQLLALYELKLSYTEFTPVDLVTVVNTAVLEARQRLNVKGERVKFAISPQMPAIKGDQASITLAIRILVENALKFSPNDSIIVVRAHIESAQWAAVEVVDKGLGIPDQFQQSIFEPFFRVDRSGVELSFSGAGVGLPLAKYIIDQHQGQLTVSSVAGHGSVFKARLPATISPQG